MCLYRYGIICINTNDDPVSSEKIVEMEKLLMDMRADMKPLYQLNGEPVL